MDICGNLHFPFCAALPVASITARYIYAFRELYADTPSLANQLVRMLRTLISFGIPRGYIDRNPAAEVTPIPIVDVQHARPWPEEAFKLVIEKPRPNIFGAPPSLDAQPAKGVRTW